MNDARRDHRESPAAPAPATSDDGRRSAVGPGVAVRQPLAGIRVLDLGTRIAAPFCAGILGEQGAEVIKIEDPGRGDNSRHNGPFAPDDDGNPYSLYWSVEGRGRKSVTVDLRRPAGQELFRRLAAVCDVVCENFRPGTLERWNIDPARLDPRLVTARISMFGQTGPKSLRAGFDRTAIAFGGLLHLTGEPDRPPVPARPDRRRPPHRSVRCPGRDQPAL